MYVFFSGWDITVKFHTLPYLSPESLTEAGLSMVLLFVSYLVNPVSFEHLQHDLEMCTTLGVMEDYSHLFLG